jgi:hypothetical protein
MRSLNSEFDPVDAHALPRNKLFQIQIRSCRSNFSAARNFPNLRRRSFQNSRKLNRCGFVPVIEEEGDVMLIV